MHRYHRFNLALILLLAPLCLTLVLTSFYLERPSGGNMTRVGGYAENDFGWNRPQRGFAAPRFERNDGVYRRYSDILVLGDSFSRNPTSSWVNWVATATGSTVQFFHYDQGGIERLLDTPAFRQRPPRLVVLESIEEQLLNRFGRSASGACAAQTASAMQTPRFSPPGPARPFDLKTIRRDTRPDRMNLDTAASYLSKAIPRALGFNLSDTERLGLTRPFFSSRTSDRLLVYRSDLEKAAWPEDAAQRIGCGLLALQRRIEANGVTAAVLLLVPDKLSAYGPYLEDKRLADIGVMKPLARLTALHRPRLDLAVADALAAGEQDLYLPNDTHFSSRGYRLAAQALLRYLGVEVALPE